MSEFDKEEKKLKDTISDVKRILKNEKEDLENLFQDFIGDREELWRIANAKEVHISNLEVSTKNPYFARIDFTSDDDGKTSSLYIGKNGIYDEKNNIIVVDWRAPISSLYYNSDIGRSSYSSPEGIISGNLDLKRQFDIQDGVLNNYFDVDLVTNDGLLQKYLNDNNDSRLKSIVSTIQKEQNDVIRRNILENLIIQGIAGSGKTTVALHRIAYLVYNYINSIGQEQYLVIGPNPVFLKYIKSVLPELDVVGVSQQTFEEFALDYIGEEININNSDKKMSKSISGKYDFTNDKFKCSSKYKCMIDSFMSDYIDSLTNEDLYLNGYKVFDSKKIKEVFNGTSNNSNLKNRIETTIEKLSTLIETNRDSYLVEYGDYIYDLFGKAKDEKERNKIRSQFAKDREEINKNCKNSLKKYFSKVKITPTKVYKLFVSSINNYDIYNYKNISQLKKDTLSNIKNNTYDFEDLSALMYIKAIISPDKEFDKYRHTVIDEAQDFGSFNFMAFKKCLPNSTFSIFGDLAQSIYDYRSVDNWNEANLSMFNNSGEIIDFKKSYRTTSEIMDVADSVSSSIGIEGSDVVLRHGDPVGFDKVDDIPRHILSKIKEFKEKGYKTIAIISKTDLLSRYINDDLFDLGLSIPNVNISDDLSLEENNICTISNQLSKGLEFDAVIINNASENIYSSNSTLDMKLLYVAITRALHEVDIVYDGELTNPLNEYLKRNIRKK